MLLVGVHAEGGESDLRNNPTSNDIAIRAWFSIYGEQELVEEPTFEPDTIIVSQPEPPPEPRMVCSSIRGTDYTSQQERDWYLVNCITRPPVASSEQPTVRQATPLFKQALSSNSHLERIKQCESGGNYITNTGNGYYGAYQFDLPTWKEVGGTGLPSNASPEEQDMRAQLLYERAGSGRWPVCQYR